MYVGQMAAHHRLWRQAAVAVHESAALMRFADRRWKRKSKWQGTASQPLPAAFSDTSEYPFLSRTYNAIEE